jgi:hypothetical protein
MAGPVELRRVDAGRPSQPVERVVPCQRVRPFMAEHLDGLRLTQVSVEMDHEPLFPPKALAQNGFGEPGGPNDDGEGWRALPPKSRQSLRKLSPAGAVHEGEGGTGTGVAAPTAGQGSAVAAENASGITTAGNHPCSVALTKPARYLGVYGHAATTTHQYRSKHPEGC